MTSPLHYRIHDLTDASELLGAVREACRAAITAAASATWQEQNPQERTPGAHATIAVRVNAGVAAVWSEDLARRVMQLLHGVELASPAPELELAIERMVPVVEAAGRARAALSHTLRTCQATGQLPLLLVDFALAVDRYRLVAGKPALPPVEDGREPKRAGLLSDADIDSIVRIGRDEDRRATTIGLVELQQLADQAKLANRMTTDKEPAQ